jgi:hypothetical protein
MARLIKVGIVMATAMTILHTSLYIISLAPVTYD